MNYMPKLDRRSFLVGSATVGLSLGFHVPFMSSTSAQGAPEINAWVVIKPDETVVIRIARSEMGQGTLTGLAQMVAEELECDWSKVTTEYPTPGESVARNRLGRFRHRRQPRHPHVAGLCAQGRRGGAHDADPGRRQRMEGAGVRVHRGQWRDHPQSVESFDDLRQGRGRRGAKIEPPKEVPLKDPKDWKVIGKSVKRLDTVDKTVGKMMYGADVRLPGMLNAAIKACPVFGGKVKSFDATKVER